jgi:RNA 3'-terminal phosphate cyclase (ATP)
MLGPVTNPMLTIDGSIGEGGGQILRTALSLSLATRQPFRIENIRARRKKPGLQAQHLAAVRAAATISQAEIEGAGIGSLTLVFHPGPVTPGEHAFAVGTAGSATLVLQTVLPALVTASGPSALVLEGGTHNPMAPPFEFLAKTFLPLLQRMGSIVRIKLDRHGFYPAGGGKMRVAIAPVAKLARLDLTERGRVLKCRATAVVANLPCHIAERELKVLKRELDLDVRDLRVEEVKAHGPGNVVFVEVDCGQVTEVFCGFGELGVRAEVVAGRLAKDVRRYLDTEAPVGEHLADQLLLPLALAGGGSFVTLPLSLHATTNVAVLKLFLPVEVKTEPVSDDTMRVEVMRRV